MFCVDSWQTSEVRTLTDPKKDEKFVSELIYDLKPWTQYAIYVQTYTLATADRGAISSIVYFMTQPDGKNSLVPNRGPVSVAWYLTIESYFIQ